MKQKTLMLVLLAISGMIDAQKVKLLNQEGLEHLMDVQNDSVYVINFWATWCSPCIEEIAYFQELHDAYMDQTVRVMLISLDFPNQVEKRVIPFLSENRITASVYNMTELDYNSWIPLVDGSWSGAIPATLILSGEQRKFLAREVSKEDIFNEVEQMLN